mgnify:CR=1 FL=1
MTARCDASKADEVEALFYEALAAGAEAVLLDNVSPELAAELVRRVARRVPVELSGNVRLDTIAAYARTGVDFISCGALTHSAPAADLSLEMELQGGAAAGEPATTPARS